MVTRSCVSVESCCVVAYRSRVVVCCSRVVVFLRVVVYYSRVLLCRSIGCKGLREVGYWLRVVACRSRVVGVPRESPGDVMKSLQCLAEDSRDGMEVAEKDA